jgi:cysteine desulfurase
VAIYLDHNATTPIAPEVREAMRPYLEERFGNPSSAHEYGRVALEGVERARAEVAALLRCDPDSIVFTASGSEADNLAIKGVAMYLLGEGDHIITSAIEHPAVLGACRYLERRLGYRLTILPVDEFGATDPEEVRRAIEARDRARLQGLFEAADGTRTHDLLHGKQTATARAQPLSPCK